MTLNPEWRRRLDNWRNTMPNLFFRPLGTVDMAGFTTTEQLAADAAQKRTFTPMPPGTPWGAKWEYGWFRGALKLPKTAAGERIALRVDVGGEAAISINGANWGANDIGHKEVTLTRKAKGGETFALLVESYAGHGLRTGGGGPAPDSSETIPEPPPAQVRVGATTFGIWEEELYQLWFDLETLLQLRDHMGDRDSLRLAEIDDALQHMTLVVDLELPRAGMLETVRRGRALLKPLLARTNGPSAPFMHGFGHSHIDIAWLWPLQETERKCCRTFSSQLALMEEYPEYRFLQSQPHLYRMVKERYPDLYARVKAAVKKGQWIPDGGMWVEADTNITGGESLIRQFIHGKRYFKDEFGVDSKLMWLPDVFGYSGALPQIMQGCGISYFSTQKIFWTYNGGDPFPYNTFWWEGIDGTRILSYLHNDYNSKTDPHAVLTRWKERVQKDGSHKGRLMPFGWGDGGGGPTREHLEFLRRQRDLEGAPRCEIRPPAEYFHNLDTARTPTWVGELYFQAHRGTYTSQAKTKKGNRQCEFALREAELWGAAAGVLGRFRLPGSELDGMWKNLLLNQFHDIIPGSSIHRVYEEAEADYARILARARSLAAAACAALLKADKTARGAVTVFNSLSWNRDAVVELPAAFAGGAESATGRPLPVQEHDGRVFALVPALPACGWTTLRPAARGKTAKTKAAVRAGKNTLENEFLKLTFNAAGELAGIFDKEAGRELAAGPCNAFRLYRDVPGSYDAWDIDSMYKQTPVELGGKAKLDILAQGPLFAALRLTRTLHQSALTQDILLRAGSRRVEFRTTIDWRESHKLLKANFPLTIRSEEALHEIQFGHIRRPTHATRPYDASRFEVCNQKWTALTEEGRGAAVLNDSKYGVSVEGNSINLTLLKSPLAPDMTADKGVQTFTYALACWNGAFKDSGVVRDAYELNIPPAVVPGAAAADGSLFQVADPNVILETVKPAEDGSGDVVLRLYESVRTATRCELRTSLPVKRAVETDMLENRVRALALRNGALELDFRPFEIKTIRLSC